MRALFTKSDIGCYADGAFGQDHRRSKLANLIVSVSQRCGATKDNRNDNYELIDHQAIVHQLINAPSNDFSEEHAAIEIIQDHTELGLTWQIVDGDLMLITETELELDDN